MSLPDLQEPLNLLEEQNVDAAVEALERKVTRLPAHVGAYVLLAHAYEAQDRWERALEAWEEVHFLVPNSPVADTGKRRVLRCMDEMEDGASMDPAPRSSSPTPPDETAPESPADDTDTADETEPAPEEASELAQLRRHAEREARQGGARAELSDVEASLESSSEADESSRDAPTDEEPPAPTPEEQVEQLEDEDDADDLDRLINKLQSARIDPDPDAEPPAPTTDEESDEPQEVVSETLAQIHEGQGDYEKAAHIYDQLAEQEPERADAFRAKADEMRENIDGSDEES